MNKAKNGEVLENFVLMLLYCPSVFLRVCFFGLRRVDFKDLNTWSWIFTVTGSLAIVLFLTLSYQQAMNLYLLLLGALSVIGLFVYGFKPFRKHVLFQKAIKRSGLKSAIGEMPKIKAIIPIGENRSKVVVETLGVGLNKFKAQSDSLTAGFRQKIESIAHGKDMGKVEIVLCEGDLPKMVGFHELYAHVKEPYSFIVGQSIKGVVVQKIQSLPHLLISGATGGGKSVFFRFHSLCLWKLFCRFLAPMLSLLKSSPHIQLYLLDLKRGASKRQTSPMSVANGGQGIWSTAQRQDSSR